ncbi:MAG TPA: hypothetical protein VI413_08500 [Paludibacter sp.]
MIQTKELCPQSQVQNNNRDNNLTIFVVPSVVPIDWLTPSALFKSTAKCYLKALWQENHYIIGHTIARISSPLLNKPYYIAMCGKVITEKPELLFVKKLGFGAMGATIQGTIESESKIKSGLALYAGRNKVAYMRFKINDRAVQRLMKFVVGYQTKSIAGYAPCDLYNGATWPRYEKEGSGCSAFGMALLDVAGILPPESKDWEVSIKMPMDLIGGEYNNYKKISVLDILTRKNWYKDHGTEGIDFITYKTYDPAFVFNWIMNMRTKLDADFQADSENGIPGLLADRSQVVIPESEPVFMKRKDSDIFVRCYHDRIRSLVPKSE